MRRIAVLGAALVALSGTVQAQGVAMDPRVGIALDQMQRAAAADCNMGHAPACEHLRWVEQKTVELAGIGAACQQGIAASCAAYNHVAQGVMSAYRGR